VALLKRIRGGGYDGVNDRDSDLNVFVATHAHLCHIFHMLVNKIRMYFNFQIRESFYGTSSRWFCRLPNMWHQFPGKFSCIFLRWKQDRFHLHSMHATPGGRWKQSRVKEAYEAWTGERLDGTLCDDFRFDARNVAEWAGPVRRRRMQRSCCSSV
jgi:hypothetical protein